MFAVTEIGLPGGTVSVIAEVHTSEGTIFLAERYAREGMTLEYVVAFCALTSASGTYSDSLTAEAWHAGGTTRANREAARADFLGRVRDSIWS